MPFLLSHEAEEDIIGISENGIRLFGAAQARKYHNDLFTIFELIASNPRIARERYELLPPIRIHPFKAHLIIYMVRDGSSVFFIRVRHSHEDWSADFS